MEKATHRVIFSRQPARIMLVDFSNPFDMDTCYTLQQSISQFFCIACNLSGPQRAPLFGIFALGSYPETILPLQSTKNNLPRIEAALNEMQILFNNSHEKIRKSRCLCQGLQEAIAQFKRQTSHLSQSAGYWCQSELTIVTCQNGEAVARDAERVIKTMELDSLRKVQVLVLNRPDLLTLYEPISESQSSNMSDTSGDDDLEGIVDIITVESDPLSIENFFKTWLQDTGTDKEHLHLVMPKVSPDSEPFILKCDLHERLINPALLSCAAQFCLQIDGDSMARCNPGGSNKTAVTVPVYKMRVEQLVCADSICESIVFGQPLVVKPTSCWKMDWDELEKNQQHFHALCHLLQEKNQVLLASLEPEQPRQGSYYSKQFSPKPTGHFVLLPSQSCTMVIRSIAVRELLLPCDLPTVSETPNQDSRDLVSSSLQQLEERESYNPLLTESGLYKCLSQSHGNKQQKRKPVTQGGPKTKNAASVYEIPPDSCSSQSSSNQQRFRPSLGKMVYGNRGSFPTQL